MPERSILGLESENQKGKSKKNKLTKKHVPTNGRKPKWWKPKFKNAPTNQKVSNSNNNVCLGFCVSSIPNRNEIICGEIGVKLWWQLSGWSSN